MSVKNQRDVFFDVIHQKMEKDKNIYVVLADMGCPSMDNLKRDYSSRVLNTGIAEQNMINVATGLALEGKKVYTFIIQSFYLRALELIRVNICGMKLPICMVGVGAGFGYADSGYTHHATEDVHMIACLPHIKVYNPSDNNMTKQIAEESSTMSYPSYIRLDRERLPTIYMANEGYGNGTPFNEEGYEVVRKGDLYILATGNMVHEALKMECGVIDVFCFPDGYENALKKYGKEVVKCMAEDNIFDFCKFKNGYQYVYGGRDKIRDGYNLSKA